jgi:acyl-coenzyme A synthetase/AMP-(fatty) acid ligase
MTHSTPSPTSSPAFPPSDLWPLCAHAPGQALVATAAGAIRAADFAARARALAERLPPGGAVLNVSQSHFGFSLGFAAALMRGCVTLMPPNFRPETVRLLQRIQPELLPGTRGDIVCLHDGGERPADLPNIDMQPELALAPQAAPDGAFEMPSFPGDQLAAIVFTSGSTGEPSGHRKTWGKLVLNARSAQARLAWSRGALVATVPPQHMYGFESSVLLALHGGHAMWHGKPMLPADIAQALADAGAPAPAASGSAEDGAASPRYLISTPWHLSLVLDAMDSGLALPAVNAVLSATAPLPIELAQRVEDRMGAPVFEIYGSTETGQIATHRSVHGSDWELLDGVRLTLEPTESGSDNPETAGVGAWVSDGHVEGRVPLADMVSPIGERHFRLIGRRADMVNIAGKRHSIAALNAILQRLPGVKDGAFFDPSASAKAADAAQVQRLCAFVVAPGLDARAITQALREHIDPVFLPRPLWLLDELPRNATSKLPRSELQALHARLTKRPG